MYPQGELEAEYGVLCIVEALCTARKWWEVEQTGYSEWREPDQPAYWEWWETGQTG